MCLLLSALLLPVRPSVTRMDQSKTVEVRIMKFSPCSRIRCGINFIQKF